MARLEALNDAVDSFGAFGRTEPRVDFKRPVVCRRCLARVALSVDGAEVLVDSGLIVRSGKLVIYSNAFPEVLDCFLRTS